MTVLPEVSQSEIHLWRQKTLYKSQESAHTRFQVVGQKEIQEGIATNDDLPKINIKMFTQLVCFRETGRQCWQPKNALQCLQVEKLSMPKLLSTTEQVVYVKAMVKKSYGSMQSPHLCLKMEYQPKLIVVAHLPTLTVLP